MLQIISGQGRGWKITTIITQRIEEEYS